MQAEINKKRYSKLYPDVPLWMRLTESEPKSENRGSKKTKQILINYKGKEYIFKSQAEVARELELHTMCIHLAIKEQRRVGDILFAKLLSGKQLRVILDGREYIYNSANEACLDLNITHKAVQRALRKGDRTAWLYAEYIVEEKIRKGLI